MVTWKHKNIKIETIYTVEYIDNEKDYEVYCKQGVDEFSVVKRRKFSGDVGDALFFYFARMYDENTYYCNLFEQILADGEVVREASIEPDTTFKWSMHGWVDEAGRKRADKLESENQGLKQDLAQVNQFLQLNGIYERYREFCRMNG